MQLLDADFLVGQLLPVLQQVLLEAVDLMGLAGQLSTGIGCRLLIVLGRVPGFMQCTLSFLQSLQEPQCSGSPIDHEHRGPHVGKDCYHVHMVARGDMCTGHLAELAVQLRNILPDAKSWPNETAGRADIDDSSTNLQLLPQGCSLQ